MPRGDGSGPMGMGSQTGRGAGYCAGSRMPGFANRGAGRGGGAGFGAGRGRRCWWTGAPGRGWNWFGSWFGARSGSDPEVEKRALEQQAQALNAELEQVSKRLAEFEKQKESK